MNFLKKPACLQEFFFLGHMTDCFKVSPLAGFFLDKFHLQEYFFGNCHPTSGYFQWSVPHDMVCQSPLATGYHEELMWPTNSFIRKGSYKFQHVLL